MRAEGAIIVSLFVILLIGGFWACETQEAEERVVLRFWDSTYIPHVADGAYEEAKSWYDFVLLTLDELTGITQTIDERLEVLQNTIAACCGTEFQDPEVERGLELLVRLRVRLGELEDRVEVLENRREENW